MHVGTTAAMLEPDSGQRSVLALLCALPLDGFSLALTGFSSQISMSGIYLRCARMPNLP